MKKSLIVIAGLVVLPSCVTTQRTEQVDALDRELIGDELAASCLSDACELRDCTESTDERIFCEVVIKSAQSGDILGEARKNLSELELDVTFTKVAH